MIAETFANIDAFITFNLDGYLYFSGRLCRKYYDSDESNKKEHLVYSIFYHYSFL